VLPLGSPSDITFEITVKFPAGYAPVLPQNVVRKTDFAEFSATYSVDKVLGGPLHVKTLLPEVSGDKRAEYSGLVKSANEAAQTCIYVRTTAEDFVVPSLAGLTPFERKAAVAGLEKQFAENPGDHQFAVALSQAHMDDHRYREAADVLEKSLAVNSERSQGINLALAKAFLGVPDADKAMDQLRNALGDQPDNALLNEAALALADANIHLDDALTYFNRAVTEISSKSSAISPDAAQVADFRLLRGLAIDWDALGWIKFRMGDAATAEKYSLAAWELKQAPSIGEHLVEVYEKLGKNKQAAKVCLLALAAGDRNAPDEKLFEELNHLRAFLPKTPGGIRSDWSDGAMALSEMRTIHIPFHPQLQKSSGSAHFVISFTSSSKPEKVVFESGAEELRGGIPALTAAIYPQIVPDTTAVRILHRAILSCLHSADDCVLVFIPDTEMALPGFHIIGAPGPPNQFPPPPGL